jgi:hypothetical protein
VECATCKWQFWFSRITHPWVHEVQCFDPWSPRSSVNGTVNWRFVKTTHAMVMWSLSHPVYLPVDLCMPRGDVCINKLISFPHDATTPSGPGPPHYRGCTITLKDTTRTRTPLDEWIARRRDLNLTQTTLTQTSMPRRDSNPQSQQASSLSPTP